MDVCLRVLKESNKSRFDIYSVRNSVLEINPIPFGIVACTFFATTFLEIAVYCAHVNSSGSLRKQLKHFLCYSSFD